MNIGKALATLAAGALFGFGLALAGMIRPEVVLSFLQWRDWGLMLVMAGGAGGALLAYKGLAHWLKAPLLGGRFGVHESRWDGRMLTGAALFGVGWGLTGVCPGPAIAGLGAGNLDMLWSLAGLAAGAWLQGVFAAPTGEGDWQEG